MCRNLTLIQENAASSSKLLSPSRGQTNEVPSYSSTRIYNVSKALLSPKHPTSSGVHSKSLPKVSIQSNSNYENGFKTPKCVQSSNAYAFTSITNGQTGTDNASDVVKKAFPVYTTSASKHPQYQVARSLNNLPTILRSSSPLSKQAKPASSPTLTRIKLLPNNNQAVGSMKPAPSSAAPNPMQGVRVWLSSSQASSVVKSTNDAGNTVYLSSIDVNKLYPQLSKLGVIKTNAANIGHLIGKNASMTDNGSSTSMNNLPRVVISNGNVVQSSGLALNSIPLSALTKKPDVNLSSMQNLCVQSPLGKVRNKVQIYPTNNFAPDNSVESSAYINKDKVSAGAEKQTSAVLGNSISSKMGNHRIAASDTKNITTDVKDVELKAQQKQMELQRQLQLIHGGGLSRSVVGDSAKPTMKQFKLSQKQVASLLAQNKEASKVVSIQSPVTMKLCSNRYVVDNASNISVINSSFSQKSIKRKLNEENLVSINTLNNKMKKVENAPLDSTNLRLSLNNVSSASNSHGASKKLFNLGKKSKVSISSLNVEVSSNSNNVTLGDISNESNLIKIGDHRSKKSIRSLKNKNSYRSKKFKVESTFEKNEDLSDQNEFEGFAIPSIEAVSPSSEKLLSYNNKYSDRCDNFGNVEINTNVVLKPLSRIPKSPMCSQSQVECSLPNPMVNIAEYPKKVKVYHDNLMKCSNSTRDITLLGKSLFI